MERAVVARFGVGHQIAAYAEFLLLGLWIGSMAFFSFAVAPGAFETLGTREMAGKVVTSNIIKVEWLGILIGPLLILIQAATWKARRGASIIKAIQMTLIVVMTAAAALSRLWVTEKMVALRIAMGGIIDNVADDDPLKLQFNDLHQYSVALMSVALFAGLAALFLSVRSWLKR
ncbi:MAG TPA: DUF4149 domain-containing protein [Blastocatellia bacterium]|nr:DUF4149 domain-containing protein [Blastocatellia bacterium]